uniref:Uncharacterized protein n=1 Tax=Oryza rufipogon TaxID=4529 RepID=A0A0E0PDZ3_ORYRU
MNRTIIVRRNYLHFVKKYQRQGANLPPCRYEKRHSNIPAHVSPCFRVKEGDHVIPAGSTGGSSGKKAFTAA